MSKNMTESTIEGVVGGAKIIATVLGSGLKDVIPFIGAALKATKAAANFRDHAFLRKLAEFVNTLDGLDEQALERVRARAAESPEAMRELGEKVLLALDQSLDYEKPGMYAKLFLAFADKVIDQDEFGRLMMAVSSSHTPDLTRFANLPNRDETKWRLEPQDGSVLVLAGFTESNTMIGPGTGYFVTPEGMTFHRAMEYANKVLGRVSRAVR